MFLVRSVTAVSTWGRLRFLVENRHGQASLMRDLRGPGRSKGRYEEEDEEEEEEEAVVASSGGGGAPLWEDRATRPSSP